MRKRINQFLLFLIAVLLIHCSGKENPEPVNGPKEIFETVWNDFDRNYPYFVYKKIDWDSVYEIYSVNIDENTTSSELFAIIGEMTLILRDIHVHLSGSLGTHHYSKKENFPHNSPANAINYLSEVYLENNKVIFGNIENTNFSYLRIKSFVGSTGEYSNASSILDTLENRDGLIIDIRDNAGGNELNGRAFAGRFVKEETHYKNTRIRDGAAWDDFTVWHKSYFQPENPLLFDKKIILLTNRRVYSSAELFVLMMKTYPNMTIVGDTTGAASANPAHRSLTNGWKYTVSTWQAASLDYILIEDNGIPPDHFVTMSQESFEGGKDQILEKAIELLESEKLSVRLNN